MPFNGFISYSHAADGRLAPAVQRGLHRLAKPWHRRRALWVFRDQTGLAVTPGLWSSIQEALDDSEWFVMLASPEAAASKWVNREIEHWVATKPADRILPVVTDGHWAWDPALGDFSAESSAVPPSLRGVFSEEPLFLDLRWARNDQHLNLRHSRFRDAIAQLAAPMHGLSKDDLEGEDVRQHRLMQRLRTAAVTTVVVLGLVASLAGVVAVRNGHRATAAAAEAVRQQHVATAAMGNAEKSAEKARVQEVNARTQEKRAKDATAEAQRQEKRAGEQKKLAQQASAEATRQQGNARRQQQYARHQELGAARAAKRAQEQEALARQQSELAKKSSEEANKQQKNAEEQARLAKEAKAEAEGQKQAAELQARLAQEAAEEARKQQEIAKEQQRLAEAAADEARKEKANAEEQKRIAEEAAAEARKQKANADQQQRIAIGRSLVSQAKTMVDEDPKAALRLALAADKVRADREARTALTSLTTSTSYLGTLGVGIQSVAYGPKGIVAVSHWDTPARDERVVSLWDLTDRKNPIRLATLRQSREDPRDIATAMAFSPNGRTLALVGWEDGAVLWNVTDPRNPVRRGTLPSWTNRSMESAAFSPDGLTIGVSSGLGKFVLWDLTEKIELSRPHHFVLGRFTEFVFGADPATIVTDESGGTIWDLTDGANPVRLATLDKNGADEQALVAFNRKRSILATAREGAILLWDLANPAEPKRIGTINGVTGRIYSMEFSLDGCVLAASSSDGTTWVWDVTEEVSPLRMSRSAVPSIDSSEPDRQMALSPDGRTIVATDKDNTAALWSTVPNGVPAPLAELPGHPRGEPTVAFRPDGRFVAAANDDGTAMFWDLTDPDHPVRRATVTIHHTTVAAVAFTQDLRTVAAMGKDGGVTLTNVTDPTTPVTLSTFEDVWDSSPALAFSPDGRTLATTSWKGVTLWDLAIPTQPSPLVTFDERTWGPITFSPDGQILATSSGWQIRLWKVTDRTQPQPVADLEAGRAYARPTLSLDGRTLVVNDGHRVADLWDVSNPADPSRLATFGDEDYVGDDTYWIESVAVTPDGRMLATGAEGGPAKLWDISERATPSHVVTLDRTNFYPDSMVFSPDGRTLAATGNHGYYLTTVTLWDYTELVAVRDDPVGYACAITGRGLTEDEWKRYIPELPYQPTCPG